ncbi:hypothetical protein V8E55_006653 [Tylopilus felleus]
MEKAELTAKERSTAALQQKDVYVAEAVERLDELKSDYGSGVRSGLTLRRGSFYGDSSNSTVENVQWTRATCCIYWMTSRVAGCRLQDMAIRIGQHYDNARVSRLVR